ncbi:MAG TPA: hypothetical protein VFE37_28635 [Chloroflexota bacterium]|nr:hypothetical protein [Chloroflexota bacterium]
MQLDLDELWPDSASLVGLRFESDADFERAQALLWEHLDVYRWVWEHLRTIAVRKSDASLFAAAGLAYTEVPIRGDDEPLSAEEQAQYREWMHAAFTEFVERLRREG